MASRQCEDSPACRHLCASASMPQPKLSSLCQGLLHAMMPFCALLAMRHGPASVRHAIQRERCIKCPHSDLMKDKCTNMQQCTVGRVRAAHDQRCRLCQWLKHSGQRRGQAQSAALCGQQAARAGLRGCAWMPCRPASIITLCWGWQCIFCRQEEGKSRGTALTAPAVKEGLHAFLCACLQSAAVWWMLQP